MLKSWRSSEVSKTLLESNDMANDRSSHACMMTQGGKYVTASTDYPQRQVQVPLPLIRDPLPTPTAPTYEQVLMGADCDGMGQMAIQSRWLIKGGLKVKQLFSSEPWKVARNFIMKNHLHVKHR